MSNPDDDRIVIPAEWAQKAYQQLFQQLGLPFEVITDEEKKRRKMLADEDDWARATLPQSYIPTPLLYVRVHLNGVPVDAIVDTGAQSTVINVETVFRCGLDAKLDDRYAGGVRGVGAGLGRVVGRIHRAEIGVGSTTLDWKLSVLEEGPQMLLGIDIMANYGFDIDIGNRRLVIRQQNAGSGDSIEVSVPFLLPEEVEDSTSFGEVATGHTPKETNTDVPPNTGGDEPDDEELFNT